MCYLSEMFWIIMTLRTLSIKVVYTMEFSPHRKHLRIFSRRVNQKARVATDSKEKNIKIRIKLKSYDPHVVRQIC
jgi:hypothetical protein